MTGTLLFFVGGISLIGGYWEDQFASIGVERTYFAVKIARNEADYLAAMRDTYLGAETLLYRDPEVVFFGDSHTYSSWDFTVLQEELPVKMGSYSISGAYAENVSDLLDALKANSLSARYVVIGVSPRMFLDAPDRQQYTEQVRRELLKMGKPQENFFTLAKGHWQKVDPFVGAAEKVRESRRLLDQGLARTDSARVSQFLNENATKFKMTNHWLDWIAESRPTTNVEQVVAEIGRKARAQGIKLAAVYIPESRWLTARYTPEQREQFLRAVRAFEMEGVFCDIEWFTRGGGDDRLFVNRFSIDDFPYDVWDNAETARKWIAADESQRQWHLFDADHMNLAGAEEFTRSVTPQLRNWIEHARSGKPATVPPGAATPATVAADAAVESLRR
jgi:hypothetical protein